MSLHNFTACWQGGLFSSSDLSPDLQPAKTEGLCGTGATEPGLKHQTCNLEGTLMTYDDTDGKPSDFANRKNTYSRLSCHWLGSSVVCRHFVGARVLKVFNVQPVQPL